MTLHRTLQQTLFFTVAGIWLGQAHAAIDVAQIPLDTAQSVDPNILFLLDDSGSMRWGFMPDDLDDNFNLSSGCSSSKTYAGIKLKPCTLSGRRYLTSSYLNRIYYNPAISYQVPLKADGSGSFATPSFSNAPVNGYQAGSTTVNLNSNYLAIIADYYYPSGDTGFAVSNSTSNSNAGRAFYQQFSNSALCKASPRSDSCYSSVSVTTAEETNFAIWYSFYRTRVMAAKAGVAAAFHQQGQGMRVGYDGINLAASAQSINHGVSKFSGSGRQGFFNWLYGVAPSGGTPLRSALQASGKYLSTQAPWRENPSQSSSVMLSCRQNFAILMTDGYYNDNESLSAVGNQDGTAGNTHRDGKGKELGYKPEDPFRDNYSDSLADVAMKYWKEDLDAKWPSEQRLENVVPTSNADPAFWQHMVTFGVGFGVSGNVTPSQAQAALSSKAAVPWWEGNAEQNKINDLIHASVNGHGGFFNAADPATFAQGLADTLNAIVERVGASSTIAATAINSLQSESNLYQARYLAGDWSGDLWSYLSSNLAVPQWKASEQVPAPSARSLWYGADSGEAKPLLWTELSSAEQASFDGNSKVLDYLRGDRSQEQQVGGSLRDRKQVLGDMVNSSPALVAEPQDLSYHRFSWSGASSYRAFVDGSAKERPAALYVGSNDGMLHGFDAATGREFFGYVPRQLLKPAAGDTVNPLYKYAQPSYSHQYSVDGSPMVADVYFQGRWRTVLVAGLARGGDSVFALDITDPTKMDGRSVLWDVKIPELGQAIGEPKIVQTNSGQWVALLSYGYNNSANSAGLLVIDLETGTVLRKLAAGAGSTLAPNASSPLSVLDFNSDGMVDWVYMGDYQGHVWKFDLSDANSANWKLAYNGQPLFRAMDASNQPQPISAGLQVSIEAKTGDVWLLFGTGALLSSSDIGNSAVQSLYGIKDGRPITGRSELAVRVMDTVGEQRMVAELTQLTSEHRGWYLDLTEARERVLDTPLLLGNDLVVNTAIPDENLCNPSGSGYIMALEPFSGLRLKKPFFDLNQDGEFGDADKVSHDGALEVPAGILISSQNSVPTFAKLAGKLISVNNREGAELEQRAINPSYNAGIQSWRELTEQ